MQLRVATLCLAPPVSDGLTIALETLDRLRPPHRIIVETCDDGGWRATITDPAGAGRDEGDAIIREARLPEDAVHAAVSEAQERGWIRRA